MPSMRAKIAAQVAGLGVGWHSHRAEPALQWWVEKLRDPRLVGPLLHHSY